MYGICRRCGGDFPIRKGIAEDRATMVMSSHDDERGYCPGSGMEPADYPVEKPYRPGADDSAGFGGGLSDF